MFDPEFAKFYDSVKDPSWPDISEYQDFVTLDPAIKKECFDQHGLRHRINEITDKNYWIKNNFDVCVLDHLAFVPVAKCAYTFYTTKLNDLGWKQTKIKNVDLQSTKFFGLMMHPLKRYLKGITQMLVFSFAKSKTANPNNPWLTTHDIDWEKCTESLQCKYMQNFINKVLVGDEHAMPLYLLLGDLVDRIHWIPMDIFTDNEIKSKMMEFCSQHNHELKLDFNEPRIHQSSLSQLEIYETVKKIFFNPLEMQQNQQYHFYNIFGPDLKFYYLLLDKYNN